MHEVQMNLTKFLTMPYSASKIPKVNIAIEKARTRVCLCLVFK
jgi:hypothetical protein